MTRPPRLGARIVDSSGIALRVWAPDAGQVTVLLPDRREEHPLEPAENGHHEGTLPDGGDGDRYLLSLDGGEGLPDPASRWQPSGPHGPSAVFDPRFAWTDDEWHGPDRDDLVIYELHVGTFTDRGTFEAVIPHLPRLADLGVTAVELMPVAEFPGGRNWGYDGVFPSAADHEYGGPDGLRALVDACHAQGLALLLDVVYNHLGPEGNVLGRFGPYFTDRYETPWGAALNFDGPWSDQVRDYFVDSALGWIEDFHVDGLRLDAVHAIVDNTAYPFVEQLGDEVHSRARELGREVVVIAESSANDPRLVRPRELGGFALDGVWNDDFHHALHTVLTDESSGYYEDYGSVEDLATAYRDGFVLSGRYSPFRGRHHGRPATGVADACLVVCSQNHDQVGNRMLGERLSTLVDDARLRFAAAAVLLSPFTPLLFMGEEYGEPAPFLYFVSHTDPDLVAAVRSGRAGEFAAFGWDREPPDPQSEETFRASKLDHSCRGVSPHREVEQLTRELLKVRREVPVLTDPEADTLVEVEGAVIVVHRRNPRGRVPGAALVLNASGSPASTVTDLPAGRWKVRVDTAAFPDHPDPAELESAGAGPEPRLAPWSAILLART